MPWAWNVAGSCPKCGSNITRGDQALQCPGCGEPLPESVVERLRAGTSVMNDGTQSKTSGVVLLVIGLALAAFAYSRTVPSKGL